MERQVLYEVRKDSSVFFEFYSRRELVIKTIDNSEKFFAQFIAEPEAVGAKVILRELLMNAVIQGNKSNRALSVRCDIEYLGEKRFKIWVEDEGGGFDHGSVVNVDQDFQYPKKGRGYVLINRLSDRIQFNEKGNRVTVYLKAKT
jgi:serine/threonine-protein kinase RsbW